MSSMYDNDFEDEYETYGVVPTSTTSQQQQQSHHAAAPQDHHQHHDDDGAAGGEMEMTAAHNAFVKALVNKGVMGKLRAQLRSSVVGIIMNNPRLMENNIVPQQPKKSAAGGTGGGAAPLPADKQYALAMCVEFLSSMGYDYSLGVLLEESNFAGAASTLISRGFDSNEHNDGDDERERMEFESQKEGTSAVTESTWDRAVCHMRRELHTPQSSSSVLESLLENSRAPQQQQQQQRFGSNSASINSGAPPPIVHSARGDVTSSPKSSAIPPVSSISSPKPLYHQQSSDEGPSPNQSLSLDNQHQTSFGDTLEESTASAAPGVAGEKPSTAASASVQSIYATTYQKATSAAGGGGGDDGASSIDYSDHSAHSVGADKDDDDQYDTVIEVPMSAAQSPAPKQQNPNSAAVARGARSSTASSSSSTSYSSDDDVVDEAKYEDDEYEDDDDQF